MSLMWLDHLKTIVAYRKRGAAKAAETRRRKQSHQASSHLPGGITGEVTTSQPRLTGRITGGGTAGAGHPSVLEGGTETVAATQPSSAGEQEYSCGVCDCRFEEELRETAVWIGCDGCDMWYHCYCVGIDLQNEPDSFLS